MMYREESRLPEVSVKCAYLRVMVWGLFVIQHQYKLTNTETDQI